MEWFLPLALCWAVMSPRLTAPARVESGSLPCWAVTKFPGVVSIRAEVMSAASMAAAAASAVGRRLGMGMLSSCMWSFLRCIWLRHRSLAPRIPLRVRASLLTGTGVRGPDWAGFSLMPFRKSVRIP